jgi:hypothetical protein
MCFAILPVTALWAEQPWWVGPDTVAPLELPHRIRDSDVIQNLMGYDFSSGHSSVLGHTCDLNGDGVPDYIVRSAPILCGTGGCPYALFDGNNGTYKGQVFGTVIRSKGKAFGGWAVLEAFSRTSAQMQTYTVYAVNGDRYEPIAGLSVVSEEPLWLRSHE